MDSNRESMGIIHMNGGNEESSYASNSLLQKSITRKARLVLEDTVKDLYNNEEFPVCFKIADFGCSSGPNTFLSVSNILDTIHCLCLEKNRKAPEFHISLNDLPGNDFNTIFKSLQVSFLDKIKDAKGDQSGPCFVSGVPGSFYERLFERNSLHFVHSSSSLHWLSQVPKRLEKNKGTVFILSTSPPYVFDAYLKQFQRDFLTFLRLRSEEIIPHGRMVLTFMARRIKDPTKNDSPCIYKLVAKSLQEMVAEGIIEEDDVDSFNLPLFIPHRDEVKEIIEIEGSFTLDRIEVFEVHWDGHEDTDKSFVGDNERNGKIVSKTVRAILEPLLSLHFGIFIIENLFERYARNVTEISMDERKILNIVISLTRR